MYIIDIANIEGGIATGATREGLRGTTRGRALERMGAMTTMERADVHATIKIITPHFPMFSSTFLFRVKPGIGPPKGAADLRCNMASVQHVFNYIYIILIHVHIYIYLYL